MRRSDRDCVSCYDDECECACGTCTPYRIARRVALAKVQHLPDSGARSEFSTGAVRDASVGKGYFSLIPPIALRAIAKRFEDGATKYGRDNWQKGIPLSRYVDSLNRHILAAAEGRTDEDHFGAILWNAAAWLWTENEIREGRLPAELDDLTYRQRVSTLRGHPGRNVMFPPREERS